MIFNDLLEKLKQEDEVTLLEILDIPIDDLVDKLEDVIFDKQDKVREYYGCEDAEDVD
jgi:hypothetical protein